MKKIFNFEKPQMKFGDLDVLYQNHFIKESILALILYIFSFICCIFMKQHFYILGITALLLGYGLYLAFQIYKSLTNHVIVIDAKCIDINRQETSILGFKDIGSKTCKNILENEEGLKFTQEVPFASTYKVGDTVRIYSDENAVSQINQNTYTVINPIYMHVLAT